MILKNYKLWRCDNTNVVIKSSYLLEIYTETFMDKMEWCHGFSSKMTWKGEVNRDMGDPAWPRVELWSWVTDTRKLLSPARLLLCLKFLHTENVSVYENASRALHCSGSQRLPPHASAYMTPDVLCDPPPAIPTLLQSHTPQCQTHRHVPFFWGGGRGGLCFLCSQMSYEAITLPSFKSLLKCPFLNDVYPTTTFLTATFFPTSQHSVSPFFPHRTYLLPKILYNLLLWYVYYFPSILPTKV